MLKLDNNLLDELGLGSLPEDQKRAMLQHIYETLELRVGTNLANQMSDQQLEEFEKFIDDGGDANQAQALQWLETNLPNYKQVVNEVFEALKLEVKQMAPQLLAANSQSVPAQSPAPATEQTYQPATPTQQPYMMPPARTVPQAAAPADYYPQPQPAAARTQDQPGFAATPPPTSWQDPAQQANPVTPAVDYQTPQVPMQQPQYPPQSTPSVPQQSDDSQQTPAPQQDYQFPQQQPPAGPGGYPRQ